MTRPPIGKLFDDPVKQAHAEAWADELWKLTLEEMDLVLRMTRLLLMPFGDFGAEAKLPLKAVRLGWSLVLSEQALDGVGSETPSVGAPDDAS
jgi:hypothetical protein